MTLDDLMAVYANAYEAAANECKYVADLEAGERAGIIAVVTALRDELCAKTEKFDGDDTWWISGWINDRINEILAPRGDEAAGAVAQKVEPLEIREVTGASPVCPAAAPDAVCEWRRQKLQAFYNSECGLNSMTSGNAVVKCQGHCPSCSRPIKFVGAAR